MDRTMEKRLIQCLEALEEGLSLEQVLDLYPDHADQLRPLLSTVAHLSEIRVAHRLESQVQSRQNFLAHAEGLKAGSNRIRPVPSRWQRLRYSLVFVMGLLIFASFGLFAASGRSLPGDTLYGTKLALEEVRLSLTNDPAARETLQNQYQQERLDEIRQLLRDGGRAEVSFSGFIESMADDRWIIAGLPVLINDQTIVEGQPAIGQMVNVTGRTGNQVVEANQIIVRSQPDVPLPTPSPLPQPTPATVDTPPPSPSPTITETPEPTPTPTITDTPSPTLTDTPSPTPTDPPTVIPTVTATPDNGNTNDNDDGNTNDNDNGTSNDNDDDNSNDNDNDSSNDNDNSNDDDNSNNND